MTELEANALVRMERVLIEVRKAAAEAKAAGFGSMVLGPLDDALRSVLYALQTANGRN